MTDLELTETDKQEIAKLKEVLLKAEKRLGKGYYNSDNIEEHYKDLVKKYAKMFERLAKE